MSEGNRDYVGERHPDARCNHKAASKGRDCSGPVLQRDVRARRLR
jgi:hypothetical protein